MAAPRLLLFLALVVVVSAFGDWYPQPRPKPHPKPHPKPRPIVVYEPVDELRCVIVTLGSDDHKTIYDDKHKPVKIKSVTVVHQSSHVHCREHVNYFYHGSELSTKHGCCATFKVCYRVTVCRSKCHKPHPRPKCRSKHCKKPRHPKTRKCSKCSRRRRHSKYSSDKYWG